MSTFTADEIDYLRTQRLGRLATVDKRGDLHVVPVRFRYNPDHDTIDIGGLQLVESKKYRDAVRHGRAAFVVDDSSPSGLPRFVEVRGTVRAIPTGGQEIAPRFQPDMLRITPTYIVSFGLGDNAAPPSADNASVRGRKVD